MAEEVTQLEEPTEQGTEDARTGQPEVDWEAKYKEALEQSRKWEKRSKDNKAKADKWDAYEQEGLSETEKLTKRAEEAEKELAKMKADAQRRTDAKEVSAASNVPESLLMYCADRDAMEAFAKEYAAAAESVPAAPQAPASRVVRGNEGKKTNADRFAESLGDMF